MKRRTASRRTVAANRRKRRHHRAQPDRGQFERLEPREMLAADPIYRINTGGPEIAGTPVWEVDTDANPSPYSNFDPGSSTSGDFGTTSPIDLSHPSIPAGTPEAVFQTQRFDKPNLPQLEWDFPVTPGDYEVRLYFSEIFTGGFQVGYRQFDVEIEGVEVLDNYDIFANAGANAGIVETFVVTSDGNLDIDFNRAGANNPVVMGIEILPVDTTGLADLGASDASLDFGAVLIGSTSQQDITLTHEGVAGDDPITIDPTAASVSPGSEFTFDFGTASPIVLQPGESTIVTVDYTPTAEQFDTATLSIPHDGLNSPTDITLDGQGVTQLPIDFDKSNLGGADTLSRPTSLQFGPDGRLYVSQQDGLIRVYDIVRNGSEDYQVVSEEVITLVQDIPNHDDDGTPNPNVDERLVTGLLVTGTAQNPVLYVTSSDPRIGGGPTGTDLNLDTNSSIISRLTWNGASWDKLDLVRGLPRSDENHALNGMALDEATNTLYVTAGGNTNMGAPSNNFAFLPEYAYSAAILSVDLDAIGETTYDLPTLDDEDQPGPDSTDPFGGNSGKNQAIIVPGGPVQVYAPGFRNPYDVVLTSQGRLYSVDNGPNADWGDVPIGEGPGGNATNDVSEPGVTHGDGLHFITGAGYYGGFPNPTRSNPNNTFNDSNPQSPVPGPNPIESDYQIPGVEDGSLIVYPNSTNGITEYTSGSFGGQLQGDLIIASFDNSIKRVKLNAAGDQVVLAEDLFSNVGFRPLDVTAPATGPYAGSIWVADVALGTIIVFEPKAGGGGTPDDLDGDGYLNDDEIANGTDPNNSADVPADNDGDFVSDLLDDDDDNDTLLDPVDFFAVDADNGSTTAIGVDYEWENEGENLGGLLGLGFTGVMANGTDNYLDLFDPATVTAGGAAGVFTIDNAGPGTALGGANDQDQALQYGFDASAATEPFMVETAVVGPFNGVTPQAGQQMGLYVGLGDQDNFVQIVLAGDNGGEVQVHSEFGGVTTTVGTATLPATGLGAVEFRLTIDPVTSELQASYATDSVNYIDVGAPIAIPASWLSGSLAAGLIATNPTAGALPVSWDYLRVLPTTTAASTASAVVAAEPGGGITGSSTFGADSFRIENTSTGGEQITSVTIDLATGFLPDMVFDPNGLAGDAIGKPFTPDSGVAATGQSGFADLFPQDDGFAGLEITFTDFDPGETFTFSVDIDPTTIRGSSQPGPGQSGSVSGLEIAGATVTVNYSDGSSQTGELFPVDGSNVNAEVTLEVPTPAAPTIELLGAPASPSIVTSASQTLRVTGAPGETVRVFQAESGLFLTGTPFDVDPFETNRVLDVTHITDTIGPGGFVDIAVTLGDSQVEGGVNHFLAAVVDADGDTGELSNQVVVALNDLPPGSNTGTDTDGPVSSTVIVNPNATDTGPLVVSASVVDAASNVVAAEYFIDTVGAEGTGVALTAADGSYDSLSEAVVGAISAADFDALAAGSHTLFVRGQDAAGNWGAVASAVFDKLEAPVTASALVTPDVAASGPLTVTATVTDSVDTVVAAEYFIDTVGAEGTGVALSAVDGLFDSTSEDVTGTIDAAVFDTLSLGVHTVFVRGQDALGAWGDVTSVTFEKRDVPETTGVVATPGSTATGPVTVTADIADGSDNVVAAEYFIDTVGAEGTGTPLTATDGSFDSMSEAVTALIDTATFDALDPGTHTVFVRGQDALGGWGEVASTTFIKEAVPVTSNVVVTPPAAEAGPLVISAAVADADSNLVAAEYFLDAVGAEGTGVPLASADGAFDSAAETVVGAISAATFDTLSGGTHTVFVRGQDAEGNWGEISSVTFDKLTAPETTAVLATPSATAMAPVTITATVTDAADNVVAAEYFLDAVGPEGTGTPLLAADGAFDFTSEDVIAVINAAAFDALSLGTHTVFVRGQDALGAWGAVASTTFEKLATLDGDYDSSGVVDQLDYDLWAATLGSTTDLRADGNENGVVDIFDYIVWRENEGQALPPPALTLDDDDGDGDDDDEEGDDAFATLTLAAITPAEVVDDRDEAFVSFDAAETDDRLELLLLEDLVSLSDGLAASEAALGDLDEEDDETEDESLSGLASAFGLGL